MDFKNEAERKIHEFINDDDTAYFICDVAKSAIYTTARYIANNDVDADDVIEMFSSNPSEEICDIFDDIMNEVADEYTKYLKYVYGFSVEISITPSKEALFNRALREDD